MKYIYRFILLIRELQIGIFQKGLAEPGEWVYIEWLKKKSK